MRAKHATRSCAFSALILCAGATLFCAQDTYAQMSFTSGSSFVHEQLQYPRVRAAADRQDREVSLAFQRAGVAFPARDIYLRVFKHERVLEVWARNPQEERYRLVKTYAVCRTSGTLGPKRRQGDRQIPEGFYTISAFNPTSRYHLSLKVSYPNARDRAWGYARPGGDIFIHGECVTVGCVPIENDQIEEVYWMLVRAHDAGAEEIPLHIFPARMSGAGAEVLQVAQEARPDLASFWDELRPAYHYFEVTRTLPVVRIAERYEVEGLPPVLRPVVAQLPVTR